MDEGEETRVISSEMEKHVGFTSGSSHDGLSEDMQDRQFWNHLRLQKKSGSNLSYLEKHLTMR